MLPLDATLLSLISVVKRSSLRSVTVMLHTLELRRNPTHDLVQVCYRSQRWAIVKAHQVIRVSLYNYISNTRQNTGYGDVQLLQSQRLLGSPGRLSQTVGSLD